MPSSLRVASALLLLAACGPDLARYPPPTGASTGTGGGGAGGGGPVVAGPVISAPTSSTWDAEASLAVAADGRMMAVWIVSSLGGGRAVGYAQSADEGETWEPAGLVPTTPFVEAVDPAVTADAEGTFHVIWLEMAAAGARRIMTAAALPGTSGSFTIPEEISDPASPADWDKPWILGLDGGALFAVWGRETGSSLVTATRAAGGAWQRHTYAPDGGLRNVAGPCAAGGARVFLSYLVPGGVEVTRSDDGGATWAAPVALPGPAAFEPPSCAAAGDQVWVAHGLSPDPGSKLETPLLDGIRVVRSTDGGGTWSGASVPDPAGARALLPVLSRSPEGRLDLVYYRGARAGDPDATLRHAHSSDGVTWSPAVALHAPLTLETARDGFGWLGDYLGVASRGDRVHVVFADNDAMAGALLSRVRYGRAQVAPGSG